MIKKFIKIKGIGCFYNYGASGDGLELGMNSIIFSRNGYGKSTLSEILKSYSLNDPSLVKARKTLGKQLPQEAVISIDGGTLNYSSSGWKLNGSGTSPEIIIFDQEYIHQNLFVQEVTFDHKKAWHQIVIGPPGVILANKLQNAKVALRSARKDFKNHEEALTLRRIKTKRPDYLTIDTSEKEENKKNIIELEKSIKAKKSEDTILEMPLIEEIDENDEIDEQYYKNILSKTHVSLHSNAKNMVLSHIEKNINEPEKADFFIKTCLKQMDENCPFCGQSLKPVESLIDAYKTYYDKEYEELNQLVNDLQTELNERYLEAEIGNFKTSLSECKSAAAKWNEYLGEKFSDFDNQIVFADLIRDIRKAKKILNKAIKQKSDNLNYTPAFDSLEQICKLINTTNESIEFINEVIKTKNDEISKYLDELSAGETLEQLEERLDVLVELKTRFTKEENEWCKNYHSAKKAIEDNKKEHDRCDEALAKYSRVVFSKHQEEINKLLPDLGADFTIEKFEGQSDQRSNTAYAEFRIVLNGASVPLHSSGRSQPCFKNTLSAGDKNTLAFAFFFSTLLQDENLADKIIIFDDPLTSLDENRRLQTADALRTISDLVKQTIVMTHKRDLLYLMYDRFFSKPTTITIRKDSICGRVLIPFNVPEDRKNEQHKRICRMLKYCDEKAGPSVSEMQGEIRKALETALKYKYFRYLKGIDTLNPILNELERINKIEEPLLSRLHHLKGISGPSHHGESDDNPIQELNPEELFPEIQKTIDILEEI